MHLWALMQDEDGGGGFNACHALIRMIIASKTPDLPRFHINSSPLIRSCGPAKHMTIYEVGGAILCNRL